jgi:hypothetical protein
LRLPFDEDRFLVGDDVGESAVGRGEHGGASSGVRLTEYSFNP